MRRQNFWAKFYRKFHFSLQNWELTFNYKGDEITYIYPWNRKNEYKYWSVLWNGLEFRSLEELDKFNQDCNEFHENIIINNSNN